MKYRPFITETFIFIMICVCLITFAFAVSRPNEDIDLEDEYDLIGVKNYTGSGDMSVGGDSDVTGDQTVGGDSTVTGTVEGGTVTDGTMTSTAGVMSLSKITATTWIYSADQVYGVEWNGELSVPTKNAVYDKVEVVNTAVDLNTAKVTNATHTGDVTGAIALTIGADKVLESMLKCVNSAIDEYALTYESTTGDFEWQEMTGGGGGNSFETMDVDNGTDPVADSSSDTLTWVSGTGIKLTGDSALDKITAAVSDKIIQQLTASGEIYTLIQAAYKLYLGPSGNLWLGDGVPEFGTSAENVFAIKEGTAPTSSPAGMVQLYCLSGNLPQSSHIKAYWKLDEASGTIFDNTANDRDGTYNGALYRQPGKINYALGFDGTDDYVTVPDGSDFSFTAGGGDDTACSFATWVFMDDATSGTFLGKRGAAGSIEWLFQTQSTDQLKLSFYDKDSGFNRISRLATTAVTSYEGSWVHFAGTYDGSNLETGIKLYINGVAVALTDDNNGTYNGMTDGTAPLNLGVWNEGASDIFDGNLDEAIVWDVELTAGEVEDLYALTSPGINAELLVRDENGNITGLSPHSFKLFKPPESSRFPWSYYSYNNDIGVEINVDMYGAIKAIEELTGKKIIYERSIEMEPIPEEKRLASWVKAKRNKELQFRAEQAIIRKEAERLAEIERIANLPITELDKSDTGIIP